VDFLEHVVERWWANRDIHAGQDQVDFEAVFASLRERVRSASSLWDFAVALREELWALKDGHLRVGSTFQRAERRFSSGTRFTVTVDGVALAGVPEYVGGRGDRFARGDLLLEIDGQAADEYLRGVRLSPASSDRARRHAAVQSLTWQELFPGESPRPRELTLRNPSGGSTHVELQWSDAPGPGPTPHAVRSRVLAEGVGYLEIRTFYCRDELGEVSDLEFSRQVRAAIDRIRGVRELIVDVRENQGGRDQQARIAAGYLTTGPLTWFRYVQRAAAGTPAPEIEEDRFDARPGVEPVGARVWLLTGPGTFSTAEIFVAALQSHTGWRVIGEPTAGSVGNPQPFRLPNTGLPVQIPITQFAVPRPPYAPIEGLGLTPDILCAPTALDLRQGRDTALETALDAIRTATPP
jgi:hypothetical protein